MTDRPATTFEDLLVWRKAHALVLDVYHVSTAFPKTETYGLTSQLRRAAVSVPANIAEGFRRRSAADKVRMLNIAQASLEEARYYLILARDLDYANDAALHVAADEVSRLLTAYAGSIRRNSSA